MTRSVISQLVNGFVAVMLLSACVAGDQDGNKPAIVAAKPVVKVTPSEVPVTPKLKPRTPIKAPASPRLSEPEAAGSNGEPNGIQPPGGREGPVSEAVEKDPGSVDEMPAAPAGDLGAVPAPAVIPAEPEPVAGISSPDELKSKAESEVVAILGRPVATRSEGTGTVWTYRAGTCSLDVYFFLDVADNQRRALSYEMAPAGAEDDASQSCYMALKEAHHVQ
jgi:hypothetical protein